MPAQMPPKPELRHGAHGPDVSRLQQLLEDAGHSPGPIDGIFGPRTEAAVRSYQEAKQLNVDGIVGPEVCYMFECEEAERIAVRRSRSGGKSGKHRRRAVPRPTYPRQP
jgi:peptidoglycan hydrolase-like protein with peptidoglycan-binding domain